MGRELINRITVKKDGRVVISSHSANDTAPYHAWESKSLTKAFTEEGQAGLDKEIFGMIYNYCELRGNHPSVIRYRSVVEGTKGREIWNQRNLKINKAYDLLSEEDKATKWSFDNKTDAMKDYYAFEKDCEEIAFREMAKLLNSEYSFSTTIYHYDDNGNEYWYDDAGKRKYTKEEG